MAVKKYREEDFCDERHKSIDEVLDAIDKKLLAVFKKLDGRPSWLISGLITFLLLALTFVITLYVKELTGG